MPQQKKINLYKLTICSSHIIVNKIIRDKSGIALKKFGAMIGDNVEVGCGSILNPGTVVGPDSNIYPLSSVREVIPAHSIYKKRGEVAEKVAD